MHSVWYVLKEKKQRNLDLIVLTFFVLQIRWWFGFGSRSHDWPTRKVVNSNALLFWTAVYTSSTARARASEYTGMFDKCQLDYWVSIFGAQCPRTDLIKRCLPIPKTTTAWKLITHRHQRRKCEGSFPNSLRPISYFESIWEFFEGKRTRYIFPWTSILITHTMATANLNKSEEFVTNTTTASKYIP